jgi:hypothetical protein
MYDPLAEIDAILSDPVRATAKRRKRRKEEKASLPALTPEERQGLMSQLGSGVVSGLSAVGNVLDIPGSMVRDALAGQNPLDQLLSPLTDRNRVTGRDLMRQYGLVGRKDNYGNWWGGLAAEIALDPLTYLTFGAGAATKAGTLAKNAGIMGKATRNAAKVGKGARALRVGSTLDEIIDLAGPGAREAAQATAKQMGVDLADLGGQKIGGLMGVKLNPFANEAAAVFGQGPTAEKIAGGLDAAGHAARYGKYSPLRPIAPLFDSRISGTTEAQQKLALEATEARKAATAESRNRLAGYYRTLHESGLFDPKDTLGQENIRHMRRALEGVAETGVYQGRRPATDLLPANLKQFGGMLEEIRQEMPKMLQAERDAGLKTPELEDFFADYFPRGKQEIGGLPTFIDTFLGRGKRVLESTHPYQKARRLRDVPGGADAIAKMAADPNVSGVARRGRRVPKPQLDALSDYLKQNYSLNTWDTSEVRQLASYLSKLDPRYARESKPFWEHPLDSLLKRQDHSLRATSTAKLVQETLASVASLQDADNMAELPRVLADAGLTDVADKAIRTKIGAAPDAKLFVPQEVAKDVARLMQTFTQPDEAKAALQAIDAFTNAFKLGVTSPFPGFHVRNFISGQFNNYVAGAFSPQALKQANDLMGGKEAKGLGSIFGKSDVEGTKLMADELFAHGVYNPAHGPADVDGVANIAEQIPGLVPLTPGGAVKQSVKTAGRSVGSYVEGLNRIAPYIELRRQGVQPAEAAKRVFAAQVDYKGLSQFERGFMRRVVPFYSFSRGVAPFIFKELMERPGGRMGQAVRASNRSRGEDFVPEQVSSTMAAPIGGAPEGFSRYLTGLGLAHEDPLNLIRPGANAHDTVKQTIQELLGRTNPLVKAPLELGFGIQAFSGRDMRDLDPGLGRIIANVSGSKEPANTPQLVEQLLANSPASRALTTVRTLTDTREGRTLPAAVNLLTGVRVTDVDTAKAEQTAIRERLEDLLRGRAGVRRFENLYAPDPDALSTGDAVLMSLYRQNLLDLQKAKREAKAKPKKRRKARSVEDMVGDLLS